MTNRPSDATPPAPTVRILNAGGLPGDLYAVMSEDEEIRVFDTAITALGEDGVVYVHSSHVVRGWVECPDGLKRPNRNYRDQVERFVERVEARGRIDLRYWHPLPAPATWAEREAYNVKCEADERAWSGN